MKNYVLYVFTQFNCPPCERLKAHLNTMTEAQRNALQFVPLKTPAGQYTALAEDFGVTLSPTLVVAHEGLQCRLDDDGDEDCDYIEETVERFVGANAIIENLDSTIDGYTYANPAE